MRLWHKDLIDVLPRQQLLGQWRECCCIARNIAMYGTPNHILVNRILDYPLDDFVTYTVWVQGEAEKRGYSINVGAFNQYFVDGKKKNVSDKISYKSCIRNGIKRIDNHGYILRPHEEVFSGWHDARYLQQCYFNLEEKYDCGGITDEEWGYICSRCNEIMEGYV